ncbi:hypothetical protein MYAM1_000166 [Malassezia yamatoensis]|uniref:Enoyl reductase (ER) domain-containing protein n=1 Tax=Malassezia yamatoensis TaxID=253288 RepID=A0AAJ6CEN9_9BASI|nr:hypothetical protein MYAM1_000166 [Malassezia yamatoensis]
MTAPDNSLPTQPAKGNQSYVLQAIEKTTIEDRPIAPLRPYEVRVNIRQTGLCGSDCHYKSHGRIGDFVLRKPMVLGHESAGIITEVGSQVKDRQAGDRVALEPGVPCCSCARCLAGNYSLCDELVFAATPPYDGTLATFYNLHAAFAHPVPDNMSLEAASLMEPLSVAVHATATVGKVQALDNVLILGAGPIGLLAGAVARAYGAKRVVSVDLVDEKLDFARQFCATSTFKSEPPLQNESGMDCSRRNAETLVHSLGKDMQRNGGFDLAIEATGAQSCLQMACWAVGALGRIVAVGMGNPEPQVPITRLMVREISFKGSFRYSAGDYEKSIGLASTGKIDVERLVTHRYLFEDADLAFDATARGKGEDGKACIKVQICQGKAS